MLEVRNDTIWEIGDRMLYFDRARMERRNGWKTLAFQVGLRKEVIAENVTFCLEFLPMKKSIYKPRVQCTFPLVFESHRIPFVLTVPI